MKNTVPPLFIPAPFFMVRTPRYPLHEFFSLPSDKISQEKAIFQHYQQDPLFREAIAIASPSLYETLLTQKIEDKLPSSLLRYFLRSRSRSTPFGLFSFVSLGSWGQTTSAEFDLNLLQKHVRPDMEWLTDVIDQLCSNPLLTHLFPIKKNPFLTESAGRIFLNYLKQKEDDPPIHSISIRSSELTQLIFELTDQPISISELKQKILQLRPSLEQDTLQEVIEGLLEQQFLYFALLPSLLKKAPFAEILSRVPLDACASLHRLATEIEDYQNIPAGQGEEKLKKIHQSMANLVSSPHFLQVDTTYPKESVTLPEAFKNELAEAAEILWKLSSLKTLVPPLHSYYEKFREKYGIHRTVPLLELLSEEGLGIPSVYLEESSNKPLIFNEKKEKWFKWLQGQWALCLWEGKYEIDLQEKVLKEMLGEVEINNAPSSFDLQFEIIADHPSDIDQGNYFILLLSQILEGGATLGRFLNLLGETTKNKLQTFLKEESLEKDILLVQSSYFPKFSRYANVTLCPSLRQCTIDTEEKGTYSLQDIYVGANKERFYLTLREGMKELIVTSGNRLALLYAPFPLRFMRDISYRNNQIFHSFPWLDLETTCFLPRVKFKKTILSPAQWKVDCFQLGIDQQESLQAIEKHFQEWSQKWKLPQYFYLVEVDRRILINSQHPSQMQEIYSRLKKGVEVKLTEKIKQTEGQWVKSQNGTHLSEFVVPFVKNKEVATSPRFPIPAYTQVPVSLRWKIPGSEWLFLKLYMEINKENRFLIEQCDQLCYDLLKQNIITNWFFIRYSDPNPHVRLRFVGEKEQIALRLIPAIHPWMIMLLDKRYVNNLSVAAYEREVERYGGEELIEPAEAVFCADTTTSIALIRLMLGKSLAFPEEVLTAISLLDLLKNLGLDRKSQLSFFKMQEMSGEELKGFREWKPALLEVSQALFNDRVELQYEELFQAFQPRHEILNIFKIKLQEIDKQKKLTAPLHQIYNSILHMHCNRLLGRDVAKERKARLYAYHTLIALDRIL